MNRQTQKKPEPISTKLSIKTQFSIILIWIGLWGIFETIINIYVKENNYKIRIFIYLTTFLFALCLLS